MANTNGRVANKLRAVAVDHLGVLGLGRVSVVVGKRDSKNVGPFFQFLTEVRVIKSSVDCSVPAVISRVSKTRTFG